MRKFSRLGLSLFQNMKMIRVYHSALRKISTGRIEVRTMDFALTSLSLCLSLAVPASCLLPYQENIGSVELVFTTCGNRIYFSQALGEYQGL